jgi:hypothetical protein
VRGSRGADIDRIGVCDRARLGLRLTGGDEQGAMQGCHRRFAIEGTPPDQVRCCAGAG